MTYEYTENLDYDGTVFDTNAYPLDAHIRSQGLRPFAPVPHVCSRGYLAGWRIEKDMLFLESVNPLGGLAKLDELFPDQSAPIQAVWFTGIVHAWRGKQRETGFPTRLFHNLEAVFEIDRGRVARQWILDLTDIPDQTDDELRLSLPSFLLPERLKHH
jgi:hypothetical protein